MEIVCPLCNGLRKQEMDCPSCHHVMKDEGAVIDYLDPYMPTISMDIKNQNDGVIGEECLHLFRCSYCKKEKKILVSPYII